MKKEIFKVKRTNPKIYANFLITLSPHNNFKTSAEAWQNHSNRENFEHRKFVSNFLWNFKYEEKE